LGLLLQNRRPSPPKRPNAEIGSNPAGPADEIKLREKRLKDRLRRWEADGEAAIRDELPEFNFSSSSSSSSDGPAHPISREIANLLGGGFQPIVVGGGSREAEAPEESDYDGYWRCLGVVPSVRNADQEMVERVARRVQINTLLIKMQLGSVGATTDLPSEDALEQTPMEWGLRILTEDEVRSVVDRGKTNFL